jgi:hypothetical protein
MIKTFMEWWESDNDEDDTDRGREDPYRYKLRRCLVWEC